MAIAKKLSTLSRDADQNHLFRINRGRHARHATFSIAPSAPETPESAKLHIMNTCARRAGNSRRMNTYELNKRSHLE
jgi:hypothetical protein